MPRRGAGQDPISYLRRLIERSTKYTPDAKTHILRLIKASISESSTDIEQRIAKHQSLYAYAQILRVQEHMERIEPTSTHYKTLVLNYTKLTQSFRLNMSKTKGFKSSADKRKQALKAPPTRGTE